MILCDEEIFAFTPLGDLIRLPAGSTTVDFAFQVHTQVGMQCIGAKINHLVVPLNTKIKNGDIVEILTSKKNKIQALVGRNLLLPPRLVMK